MRTLGFTISVIVAVLLAVLYSGPAAGQAKLDGKAIFLAQKCSMCHSVSTAGIEATVKSEKMKGPDLVNVKEDAKLIVDYLRKKADIKGKKHGKVFTGTDEELGALVAWIQQQEKK
ncbi:MAG TPA: cytochrome c [Thermoanaerobaculia bacterium]